jgi:lysophospholipase L1-like esterase
MGGRVGKVVAAFVTVLALAACGAVSPKLSPLPADGVVVAYGDSLTYGTGAPQGESYPAVLEGLIGRTVVSAGVPGEVTAEGLARLPDTLARYRPALLILCHGGNDILRRLDERQTADNLRGMVRMARERGVEVMLVGVPKPGLRPAPPKFYRKIAREAGLPYEGAILAKIMADGSLKSDYIHPNARGYRMLAEAIAELLRKSGAL